MTGFVHKESDVDLAVLLDESIPRDQSFEKNLTLPPLFDIFPGYEKVILNKDPPLLKHEVVKNDRALSSADDTIGEEFIHSTVGDYEDTGPIRERQDEYVKERILSTQF